MVKLFRIVVIICMILTIPSIAFAHTEKEIMFRGVDWELSGEEYVSRLFLSIGKSQPPPLNLAMRKIEYCHFPVQNGVLHPTANKGLNSYMCSLSTSGGNLKVAGHEVTQCYGFAIPKVVDNTVYDDPSAARFVTWEYVFYGDEADRLMVDLRGKLTSIYGCCDSISEDDESILEAWVWYGAKDTCAVLYRQARDGVRLAYVKTDIEDAISTLRMLTGECNDMNTDGL